MTTEPCSICFARFPEKHNSDCHSLDSPTHCPHGVHLTAACGRCADDAKFRHACFRLRQFGADQADPDIFEAILTVLARVEPEGVEF